MLVWISKQPRKPKIRINVFRVVPEVLGLLMLALLSSSLGAAISAFVILASARREIVGR
jgi:hypothetical protein